MYKQIVVPLDGSTFAEAALPLALALSTRTKATCRRGLRVTTSVAVDAQAGHGILTEADAVGCDAIAMAGGRSCLR